MLQLVLSNTTTFFSGRIEAVFKKAQKHGFRFLEIIPYRWTRAEEILRLEKKYGVQVAGIHLPQWWQRPHHFDLFTPLWWFYLGAAEKSPGFALVRALQSRRPYLLLHSNVTAEMGAVNFERLKQEFNVVVENIPKSVGNSPFFWNPVEIERQAPLAFDPGHYLESDPAGLLSTYQKIKPVVMHLSYNDGLSHLHILPNKRQREDLKQMLRLHAPRYLVLETNPLVSVKKGAKLLREMVLHPPL